MNESSRKLANDFLNSMPAGFYTYDDLCNLEMLLDNHAAEAIEAYEKKMGVTIPDLIGENE